MEGDDEMSEEENEEMGGDILFPDDLSRTIMSELDELNAAREKILGNTRTIIQLSSRIINDVHLKKRSEDDIRRLRELVMELNSDAKGNSRITHAPYIDNALQEYCEAMILLAIINNERIPTPRELGVDPIPYLSGIGDVVGELRRYILGCLKEKEIKKATFFYDRMETLFNFLSLFHYPKAIVDIRRKRDVARSLLEKTLGELVVTAGNIELSRMHNTPKEKSGE